MKGAGVMSVRFIGTGLLILNGGILEKRSWTEMRLLRKGERVKRS